MTRTEQRRQAIADYARERLERGYIPASFQVVVRASADRYGNEHLESECDLGEWESPDEDLLAETPVLHGETWSLAVDDRWPRVGDQVYLDCPLGGTERVDVRYLVVQLDGPDGSKATAVCVLDDDKLSSNVTIEDWQRPVGGGR